MNWTLSDFAVAGLLLAALAFGIAFMLRARRSRAYRGGVFLAVLTSVLSVWIIGAVGLVGEPSHLANTLYLGGVAAAWVGALIGRFQSRWLTRILSTLALFYLFVAGISLILGWGAENGAWPWDALFLSAGLAFFWQVSAWLFGLDADIRTLRHQRD